MKQKEIIMLSCALCASFFAACLIIYPKEILDASKNGLQMWSQTVFPSLFPFFVTAELLIAFGVVRFMGVLLDPVMRPVFKVPGSGGFVWAMGFIAGFPSGAKFTVKLRKQNKLSREEAERLVSFTNSSNPLFICGAVAVGFFHDAALGLLLAFSHYSANTLVGIAMRFYSAPGSHPSVSSSSSLSFSAAVEALLDEQKKDKRPFGKKLGDAVVSSIHTLLMIGGFICLFSVLYRVLHVTDIINFLAWFPGMFLSILSFGQELALPWLSGFFEITVGSKLVSDLSSVSMFEKALITSFILGFSGLSVHAQVASLLAETDIRYAPFFMARWLHGILAVLITYAAWEPLYLLRQETPVGTGTAYDSGAEAIWYTAEHLFSNLGGIMTIACLGIYLLCLHTSSRKS
ncbi:sporulation integral membrane protein YlbJ [Salibacterium aidingense]|uniref:sporulation integral membrane protein YlbJ n=1 Tax=Salibacterium aidingense TaxID=384933 RepID=UPI00041EA7AF|nr:sporulation integral membrane protein YlbJ [Salibacterium aidingense]